MLFLIIKEVYILNTLWKKHIKLFMIISNKYKFIFLKTRKTAGSSIQVALSTKCNPESDILTGSNIKEGLLDETHSAGWNMDKFFTNHPHPKLQEVKKWCGPSAWPQYFKFAFVRNPFDIAVSRYFWNLRGKTGDKSVIATPEGFRAWIREFYVGTSFYVNDLQYPYICDGKTIDVDYVGRYENLQEDFTKICNRVGIEDVPELGFQKSGFRDKKHYSKFYDAETIGAVYDIFKVDFELFGYEFEYIPDFTIEERSPVITKKISKCENINGPSLIKVPEWVANPLGKYYLYFADHRGSHIKMAYSDSITGPYELYEGGTLQLNQTDAKTHIASPDVHIRENDFIMYFHGDTDNDQVTWRAKSSDGIHWQVCSDVLTPFYHREFQYLGDTYSICKNKNVNSQIFKQNSKGEYQLQFELLEGSRHSAVYADDNTLYIFYTLVNESPERIYVMKIIDWEPASNYELAKPEYKWEGSEQDKIPSKYGMSLEFSNQLRDPYIFNENKDLYLLYSYGGESGIALGKLKKK